MIVNFTFQGMINDKLGVPTGRKISATVPFDTSSESYGWQSVEATEAMKVIAEIQMENAVAKIDGVDWVDVSDLFLRSVEFLPADETLGVGEVSEVAPYYIGQAQHGFEVS